jgi:hypothetical protein
MSAVLNSLAVCFEEPFSDPLVMKVGFGLPYILHWTTGKLILGTKKTRADGTGI